jgi:transposase
MRPPRPIPEEALEELRSQLKTTKTKTEYRRVLAVWLRASLSMSAPMVAQALGLATGTVRRIQAEYLRQGQKALKTAARGGRRRQNLTLDQERSLLAEFLDQAKRGGLLDVSRVKAAYEAAVGHDVPKSTVYRLLARHGWRKVAPRPRHPESDPEKQEQFKKNWPES